MGIVKTFIVVWFSNPTIFAFCTVGTEEKYKFIFYKKFEYPPGLKSFVDFAHFLSKIVS